MSIHEYIFITISLIYGLAITRLLGKVFTTLRSEDRMHVKPGDFAWSAGVFVVLIWFIWIGFSLQSLDKLSYGTFVFLLLTATLLYGAVEFSFPATSSGEQYAARRKRELRFSALFLLVYLLAVGLGNLLVVGAGVGQTLRQTTAGILISIAVAISPAWVKWLGPLLLLYAILVHTPLQSLIGLSP